MITFICVIMGLWGIEGVHWCFLIIQIEFQREVDLKSLTN